MAVPKGQLLSVSDFLQAAVQALEGEYEKTETGALVRIPLDETDMLSEALPGNVLGDLRMNLGIGPLAATLAGIVRQRHGRVYAAGLAERHLSEFQNPFPYPGLLFWYRLELLSPQTRDHYFGVLVGTEDGECVAVDTGFLAALSGLLDEPHGRFRMDPEQVSQLARTADSFAAGKGEELAETHRNELLQWRSRKKREIEQVFDTRLEEMSQGNGDSGPETPEEVRRDRRQAMDRVERTYDPERLGISLSTELLVLITRPARKRRKKKGDA